MSQHDALETFCRQCLELELVSPRELDEARGRATDLAMLTREVVTAGLLTAFQARQVAANRGKSLCVGGYLLLDRLGQGGMGTVYKAWHRELKREVALKVLAQQGGTGGDATARFLRETEVSARLEHPNIVSARDAGKVGNTHFLVMQLASGPDLANHVKQFGPMSVDQGLDCVLQAARGLEYAHAQGIYHRDIKPSNLLFDGPGTVKVTDMGLARFSNQAGRGDLTASGALMGSVDYLPPEQAVNFKEADARADVYSLGLTLWYLLTGRVAYDGDSLMAKLLAHRDSPIPSLALARPEIPAELERTFLRMVAKEPQDRHQSMTEVIAELTVARQRATELAGTATSSPFAALTAAVSATASGTTAPIARSGRTLSRSVARQASTVAVTTSAKGLEAEGLRKRVLASLRRPGAIAGITGTFVIVALMVSGVLRGSGSRATVPSSRSGFVPIDDPSSGVTQSLAGTPAISATTTTPSPPHPGPSAPAIPFDATTASNSQAAWAKEFGEEIVLKNSAGMEMILIPPGSFVMGSPPTEADRNENENQVDVRITAPFRIAKTEVTQREWMRVMGTTPWKGIAGVPVGDDLPAVHLGYGGPDLFCRRLAEREGLRYELPTEAQWEWACRAGGAEQYGSGSDESWLGNHAWYVRNTTDNPAPRVVAQKTPNGFGLFDMIGNVPELCRDRLSLRLTGGPDPVFDDPSVPQYVDRGGGWLSTAEESRVARRHSRRSLDRQIDLGFRPVLPVKRKLPEMQILAGGRPAGERLLVPADRGEVAYRWCPPGTFTMGTPVGDPDYQPEEEQVGVRITRGFWMGETEVTQSLYSEVTGMNPARIKGDDLPVDGVKWLGASEFCDRLTLRDRKAGRIGPRQMYRLPTEAEWEYACRAGTTGRTYLGASVTSEQANHDGSARSTPGGTGVSRMRSVAVRSFAPNPWGLHDMLGNVNEWCADWYQPKLRGGDDPLETLDTTRLRIYRGGCWGSGAKDMRSAARRYRMYPHSLQFMGFRVVLSE
jgi:formylglycine-generating enzyme required for sulfatase activity/serine/threonine protein kinase